MRKLVAALACRNQGSRLYGKPMQHLDVERRVTILEHLLDVIHTIPVIHGAVLGISEGLANAVFVEVAQRRGIGHIIGDQRDVLQRLIACGHQAQATDIFRVTTESPFFHYALVMGAWHRHVEAGNDVTVTDGMPDGCNFEIYTLEALERSHRLGDSSHRSEFCSNYVREHLRDFTVEIMPIPPELERLDLRLTVDNPEDLMLCRRVYAHLRHKAPQIPVGDIIAFIDTHPQLQTLVAPYVVSKRLWVLPDQSLRWRAEEPPCPSRCL
ncbi:MAG: hypothetical protein A3I71_02310 [Omnitrophica WOR_2 bacterium RIFCSPLOWO2_02_FULL_63_16]|nr:MAG: hypothetical protein A3I71_02310 [Omnitrophica WOR_2 bacterium RIFCSPLOWO2_02_FULL_63_16]OGX50226.1 MAG: hypothetical protein A3G88_05440 [Omnitrophica WOR_2 bacterium RIFCSPLOWO2_12_FULL_63_16]